METKEPKETKRGARPSKTAASALPETITPGEPETNGFPPRKVVKKFSCQSSKDTTIVVEIVENEFQTQSGDKIIILCTVCSRLYTKQDGELGTSYSYRQHDLPVLQHLLLKAHAFIIDQRMIVDEPG